MTSDEVDLVAFDLARQDRDGLREHDAIAQLPPHALHVVLVEVELLGDLPVGNIQPHQVQTANPYLEGLMTPGKDRPGEIVKVAPANLAAVFLARPLDRVMALLADRLGRAVRADDAIGPTQRAHGLETLLVVQSK